MIGLSESMHVKVVYGLINSIQLIIICTIKFTWRGIFKDSCFCVVMCKFFIKQIQISLYRYNLHEVAGFYFRLFMMRLDKMQIILMKNISSLSVSNHMSVILPRDRSRMLYMYTNARSNISAMDQTWHFRTYIHVRFDDKQGQISYRKLHTWKLIKKMSKFHAWNFTCEMIWWGRCKNDGPDVTFFREWSFMYEKWWTRCEIFVNELSCIKTHYSVSFSWMNLCVWKRHVWSIAH